MAVSRVRGTTDLLDLELHNFVLTKITNHLALYNFKEIQTPFIEHTDLFIHAVGQETDIVTKEMYTFQTQSGEQLCLRPEGTASIIRAYVENGVQQSPWKVFTYGPMFRHERPQKGRWRQFSQFSIEVIASKHIEQDAHFLSMLDTLFAQTLKLENYVLKLNFLGCSDDRKKHKADLLDFLTKHNDQICTTCQVRKEKNILRTLDCKNETCKSLYQNAPKITEFLCDECDQEWKQLQELLQLLSVNYIVDTMLVRGLDYYNKTVFEFCSEELGSQSAFCGGGRYLLGKGVGAREDIPSIGVGIGMGRVMMLVEQTLNQHSLPQKPALSVVVPLQTEQQALGLMLCYELTKNGLHTDIIFDTASVTNMMKRAHKTGARYALLLGPDEQENSTVSVKDMQKGTTTTMSQTEVVALLKQ
ncbi:MAG: histidine--tRNA ligase [Epsilonproteobacteria bacterium]|nr:histidine--tRNA ligase [Campylobacterota bacterium]